jgi:hypothetical protein
VAGLTWHGKDGTLRYNPERALERDKKCADLSSGFRFLSP